MRKYLAALHIQIQIQAPLVYGSLWYLLYLPKFFRLPRESTCKIWNDFRLTWNPEEYGGLQLLDFGVNDVWIPRIFLRNV